MICGRAVLAALAPIGVPVAVDTGDAQGEHGVGALDAPPSSWQLQALLCDIAMRAFDLSEPIGRSLAKASR